MYGIVNVVMRDVGIAVDEIVERDVVVNSDVDVVVVVEEDDVSVCCG